MNAVGKILFSPHRPALAYAAVGCSLGTSTDGGASWTWINPVSGKTVAVDGLAVFQYWHGSTSPDIFGRITRQVDQDVLAMCVGVPNKLSDGTPTARSILFVDPTDLSTNLLFATPKTDRGARCSIDYDPQDGNRFFVATGGNCPMPDSGISQGDVNNVSTLTLTGRSVNYLNLSPPGGGGNCRPVFVQTAALPFSKNPNSGGVRVYYHDSVVLMYQDCLYANGGCLAGPQTPTWCFPGEPWKCINTSHADQTRLAFKPGAVACPMLLSNDGGIEFSLDCGLDWSAEVTGLHALEPWNATFIGSGTSTTGVLDLQDNGVYFTANEGTSWIRDDCGDGFYCDAGRSPGLFLAGEFPLGRVSWRGHEPSLRDQRIASSATT